MVELCLTLAVESPAGLQKKITCYDGEVPVIEVRLDFLNPVEFPVLPTGSGTRYLATCRPVREGGKFTGPESDRMEILSKASEKGFSLSRPSESHPGALSKLFRNVLWFDSIEMSAFVVT